MNPETIVTLYGSSGPLKTWEINSHVYRGSGGSLEFVDKDGSHVTVCGTYTIKEKPAVMIPISPEEKEKRIKAMVKSQPPK